MTKKSEDPIYELVLREMRNVDADLSMRIEERSKQVVDRGYHVADGAFLGAFERDVIERSTVTQIQTFSAICAQDTEVDQPRRTFLRNLAVGALGTGTAFSGWGVYVINEVREANRSEYRDEVIRKIIDLGSDRPAAYDLRSSLIGSGHVGEAELIQLVTRHGESFRETETATATLRYLLDTKSMSDLCDTFVRANYCTNFRYIGLPITNFEEGRELVGRSFPEIPKLQTTLINHRHMNSFHLFYGRPDFQALLRADNAKLAHDYEELVGAPILDISPEHVGHALEFGLETLALAGIAQSNNVIACTSEEEAVSEIDRLMPMLNNIADRAVDIEDQYMSQLIYGEALWPIGRILPFALSRGWDNLGDRLLDVFFRGFAHYSRPVHGSALHARKMSLEADRLSGPIWIQMAILKAVREQERNGDGARWLDRLLPQSKRHRVFGHAMLARALLSLEIYLGRDPWTVPTRFTLAESESSVLLDAVDRLNSL